MDMGIDAFLVLVKEEFLAAQAKFPQPNLNMVALTEEVGELAKALMDESSENVVAEAKQVAAMAARVAIEGDSTVSPFRKTPHSLKEEENVKES